MLDGNFGAAAHIVLLVFFFFFAIAVDFATDITEAKNNTKLHFALINMNFRAEITMKHVYCLLGIINKCVCCLATK